MAPSMLYFRPLCPGTGNLIQPQDLVVSPSKLPQKHDLTIHVKVKLVNISRKNKLSELAHPGFFCFTKPQPDPDVARDLGIYV